MFSREIKKTFLELRKDISSVTTDLANHIQSEIGEVLSDLPSSFACRRFQTDSDNEKRVTLDIYASGQIVFCLQSKMTSDEKRSLDTSQDYLEADMKPRPDNYFQLHIDGQWDELIKKIKEHFAATVPA